MTQKQENEFKILNKHLMLTRRNSNCSWRVEPNIFEVAKAQSIFDAKDSAKQYLPRIKLMDDRFPQLEEWIDAFSSDNPPEQVSFRGRDKELEQELISVDFSKSFDEETAKNIRNKFRKHAQVKVNIDADLIIMGELGELNEE